MQSEKKFAGASDNHHQRNMQIYKKPFLLVWQQQYICSRVLFFIFIPNLLLTQNLFTQCFFLVGDTPPAIND